VPAYHSTNYDNWGKDIKVDVASGDIQYEQDLVKMSYFGIVGTEEEYWLASRIVDEDLESEYVDFYVGSVDGGVIAGCISWGVHSDGDVYSDSFSCGVRPVVINPSGI